MRYANSLVVYLVKTSRALLISLIISNIQVSRFILSLLLTSCIKSSYITSSSTSSSISPSLIESLVVYQSILYLLNEVQYFNLVLLLIFINSLPGSSSISSFFPTIHITIIAFSSLRPYKQQNAYSFRYSREIRSALYQSKSSL